MKRSTSSWDALEPSISTVIVTVFRMGSYSANLTSRSRYFWNSSNCTLLMRSRISSSGSFGWRGIDMSSNLIEGYIWANWANRSEPNIISYPHKEPGRKNAVPNWTIFGFLYSIFWIAIPTDGLTWSSVKRYEYGLDGSMYALTCSPSPSITRIGAAGMINCLSNSVFERGEVWIFSRNRSFKWAYLIASFLYASVSYPSRMQSL